MDCLKSFGTICACSPKHMLRFGTCVHLSAQGKKDAKGSIPVYHGSMILFSSDKADLVVHNPTRTWKLTADDVPQAKEWGELLRKVSSDAKAVEAGNADPRTRFNESPAAPAAPSP